MPSSFSLFYPILFLPAALLLDMLLGDPPNTWHPICALGRWARKMDQFWKKILGKTFVAGTLAALCVSLPFVLLPALLVLLVLDFSPAAAWGLAVVAVYFCIAPRGLARHAGRVADEAKTGDLENSRYAVSLIVGRDTQSLDLAGVLRAAIESVAENLTDGVLSTLFWATAGTFLHGPEGAVFAVALHRVFNILDALWGKKNEEYRRFGTFVARTDDMLNYLPARLSLPLIALAALFIRGASALPALLIGWKYRYAHASPNSAWSEAAFAGALDLQLSGPISYKGIPAPYPYIGAGRKDATIHDLESSISLMWSATILMTILCALALAIRPYFSS